MFGLGDLASLAAHSDYYRTGADGSNTKKTTRMTSSKSLKTDN